MLYSKFQKISRACSRNFTQFSRNFGYFSHFWANFYMLGIKMHVLELRNSLVILSKNFTRMFTQFHAIFTLFGLFQPFLGQFQHVGYQKACTRAEKFIGGIWKGHRPEEGAQGPKEEAEGLQKRPKAPQSPLQELE